MCAGSHFLTMISLICAPCSSFLTPAGCRHALYSRDSSSEEWGIHFHCFLVNLCHIVLPRGEECVRIYKYQGWGRRWSCHWHYREHSCTPVGATDAHNIWAPDLTKWNRVGGYQKVSRECSEICHSELGSLPSYTASQINLIWSKRKMTSSLLTKMLYQLAWPDGKEMEKCSSSQGRMFKSWAGGHYLPLQVLIIVLIILKCFLE